MSKEGDKATVLRSTKVRTKLKGDGSWLQRPQEPQADTEKEKPWMAEVRAGRLNGAPIETSPVSSPVKATPAPEKTETDSKTPTPGYLIRGVFTKLDNKPPSSPTSNGTSALTRQYTKKPSESYKKIAPHTVRSPAPSLEGSLSLEEHGKRTEAASGVLKKSSVRDHSYVISAAKKYEAKEAPAETPPVSSGTSFVAKRVHIIDDDDEGAATKTPASAVQPSPVVPPTSAASAPQPKPQVKVDTTVKADAGLAVTKPVVPKVVQVTPEPVKDLIPQSVKKTDPVKDVKPDSTTANVAKSVQVSPKDPQPKDSGSSWQPVVPKLVQVTPEPVKDPIPQSVTKPNSVKDVKPDTSTANITKSVQVAPKEPQPKESGGSGQPVVPKLVQVTPEPVKDPIPLSVTKTDLVKDVKPDTSTANITKSVQVAPKEPQPKDSGSSWQPVVPKLVQVIPEPVKDPIPQSVTKPNPVKDVKPDTSTANITKSVQVAPKEPQPKESGGSGQPVVPKVVQVTPEPVKDPIPLSVTKTDLVKDVKPDSNTANLTKSIQAAPKEPQPKDSGSSWQPVVPKLVQVTPEPVKDPIPQSVTKPDPVKEVKPDSSPANITKNVQAAPKEPQPKASGGSGQPVAPKLVQVTPEPVKEPIPLSVTKTDLVKDVKPDSTTANVTKSVQVAPKEPQPKESGGSGQPVAPKVVQVTPEPVKEPIPLSVTKPDLVKDVNLDSNTGNLIKRFQAAPKEPQPKESGGSGQPVAPKRVQVTPEPVKDPIPLSVTKTDLVKDVKPDSTTANITKSVQVAPKEPQPKESGGSGQPVAPKVVQVTPEPVKEPIPLSVTKPDLVKDVNLDSNTGNLIKRFQEAPKEPQPKESGGSGQPVAPKRVQVTPEPVKDPIPLTVTKTDLVKDVKPDSNTANVTKSVQVAPKEPQPKESGGSGQPVAPKRVQVTPEPLKDPIPLSVTKTDLVKDVKPDSTTANVTKSVQVAPKEPQPKESGGSGQPVAPKRVQVTPEPAKDPILLTVTKTDIVKDVKPDPNTANVTKSVQVAPKEPQPKESGGSGQPVAPKRVQVTPEPVKDPIPQSVSKTDLVKDLKPDSTTANITKSVQAAPKDPQPKESGGSGQPVIQVTPKPAKDLNPLSVTKPDLVKDVKPESSAVNVQAAPKVPQPKESGTPLVKPPTQTLVSPVPNPLSAPTPASPGPVAPLFNKTDLTVKTDLKSEPVKKTEPEPKPRVKTSSTGDTVPALSDTLISFDTNSSSFKDDKTGLAKKKGGNSEDSVEQKPAPNSTLSNKEPITDDLLGFGDRSKKSAEPLPPSPGRWSQDLLSELSSKSKLTKAADVIKINTEVRSLVVPSEEEEEEAQTDETDEETQSSSSNDDSADPWSSRVKTTVTESSSADPFDPYPIGTASHNSSRSRRSWTHTWEVPQLTTTEESEEDAAEAGTQEPAEDQQTVIMFERKSTEKNSPWDRWTTPTVYTIGAQGEEEEEEEEETSWKDTKTVTTITTIREIQREPEPVMDQYVARTVEQRDKTPEPETKKGFVYVKEYVNATALSLHNARDTIDGQEAFTVSSINYSYSSPSSFSLSSTCTYCGEQVGNDAKITIEHLNINCHPTCFKCAKCRKPMGDLLDSMFIHQGKVHCESCYSII